MKRIKKTVLVTLCLLMIIIFPIDSTAPITYSVVDESIIEEPDLNDAEEEQSKNVDSELIDDIQIESYEITQEEIDEENRLGDMELISQLVQAEAGNQGLKGMQLVADVVLNRVDDPRFPNTVEEVVFEDHQFSTILDGSFDRAGWNISDEAFLAVAMEMKNRLDSGIVYFSSTKDPVNGVNCWKYKDHWFGY